MQVSQDKIPFFKILSDEWPYYCALADRARSNRTQPNKFTGKRVRELWETVDSSLPIILSSNQFWYVRILDHKGKGLMLDIRQYILKDDGVRHWYEPTDNGLNLPIGDWIKLFNPLFKLIKKWWKK